MFNYHLLIHPYLIGATPATHDNVPSDRTRIDCFTARIPSGPIKLHVLPRDHLTRTADGKAYHVGQLKRDRFEIG